MPYGKYKITLLKSCLERLNNLFTSGLKSVINEDWSEIDKNEFNELINS